MGVSKLSSYRPKSKGLRLCGVHGFCVIRQLLSYQETTPRQGMDGRAGLCSSKTSLVKEKQEDSGTNFDLRAMVCWSLGESAPGKANHHRETLGECETRADL